jgi:hypothetical protein
MSWMTKQRLNRKQLEDIGKRRGLVARPLALADLRNMNGYDEQWHAEFNKENYNAAKGYGPEFTKREDLTLDDVNRMELREYNFYMENHKEFIEKIINAPSKQAIAAAEVQRKWKDGATAEDDAAVLQSAEAFFAKYPQCVRNLDNGQILAKFMAANNLDPREVKSLIRAFEAKTVSGELTLLVNGQELTGRWLQDAIRANEKLLDPQKSEPAEQIAGRKALAEVYATPNHILKTLIEQEYRKENPQRSVFEQRSLDRAVATLLELRPSYINSDANNQKMGDFLEEHNLQLKPDSFLAAFDYLASVGKLDLAAGVSAVNGTRIIDYGVPPTRGGTATNLVSNIEKASLRKKFMSMDARAGEKWLAENPSAREAIDG